MPFDVKPSAGSAAPRQLGRVRYRNQRTGVRVLHCLVMYYVYIRSSMWFGLRDGAQSTAGYQSSVFHVAYSAETVAV